MLPKIALIVSSLGKVDECLFFVGIGWSFEPSFFSNTSICFFFFKIFKFRAGYFLFTHNKKSSILQVFHYLAIFDFSPKFSRYLYKSGHNLDQN